MLFDSHAHYDDEQYDEDRTELLSGMAQCGVGNIINVGSDMPSSRASVRLAETYDWIHAAVGVHPHDAESMTEADLEELASLITHPRVVAIGEIGLDYHYDFSPRDKQKYWFRRQLELSRDRNIPFIIHEREACRDCLDILQEVGVSQGGVLHCFSGSKETGEILLGMGMYLAFGGSLTFKNNRKTELVAEAVPMDRFLIETDAPYLTPVPHRGKRNHSAYTKYVAEKIAEIKGITYEEVVAASEENAKRLFRLEEETK